MQPFSVSRILAPVDFSRRAEGAVRRAHSLAAHFHAELILLHVLEPFHVDYAMLEPFDDSLRDLARSHRAKKQAELDAFVGRDLKAVNVTRMIVEGDPAGQILQCSKEKNADLVVMPTQGHGRLRGLLIGSVTAKVLDESERPVLTGTHLDEESDSPDGKFRNILCAVDLGTRTASVLGWGAALAKEFQAKVTVLHVAGDPKAEDRLSKAIEAAGLKAAAMTVDGDPHKVVAATAAKLKSDIVIIGRGTATNTLGRLRAQAYGILRQAPCPVLSV
jgi:nucleotide-binding universal stress UspA family protein